MDHWHETPLDCIKRHLRNWHPTRPPRCLAREDALCLKYSPAPSICDPSIPFTLWHLAFPKLPPTLKFSDYIYLSIAHLNHLCHSTSESSLPSFSV